MVFESASAPPLPPGPIPPLGPTSTYVVVYENRGFVLVPAPADSLGPEANLQLLVTRWYEDGSAQAVVPREYAPGGGSVVLDLLGPDGRIASRAELSIGLIEDVPPCKELVQPAYGTQTKIWK